MLISFTIGNFLSFDQDRTLSLLASKPVHENEEDNVFNIDKYRLLKSDVIYGANASGKSNLINSMSIMKWLIINSSKNLQAGEPLRLTPFKLTNKTLLNPSKFEISILIGDSKYRYGFEADIKEIKSEWLFVSKVKESKLFIRDGDVIDVSSKFKGSKGLIAKTRNNALFISVCAQFNVDIAEKILNWFSNFNVLSGLTDIQYTQYSANLFLSDENIRHKVKGLIQKADMSILDINVRSHKITEDKLPSNMPDEIKKSLIGKDVMNIITSHKLYDEDENNFQTIDFDFEKEESEGTKKYFRLSGPVIDTLLNGKVIVIDELDAKLHPILVREIAKLFNSKVTNPKNAQLIFATHDTNLLSSKIFRRDQIWFTEKDNRESTDLYSLSEYKLSKQNKVRKDASYQKDYMQGKYGAIPFSGDFESLWSNQ